MLLYDNVDFVQKAILQNVLINDKDLNYTNF